MWLLQFIVFYIIVGTRLCFSIILFWLLSEYLHHIHNITSASVPGVVPSSSWGNNVSDPLHRICWDIDVSAGWTLSVCRLYPTTTLTSSDCLYNLIPRPMSSNFKSSLRSSAQLNHTFHHPVSSRDIELQHTDSSNKATFVLVKKLVCIYKMWHLSSCNMSAHFKSHWSCPWFSFVLWTFYFVRWPD